MMRVSTVLFNLNSVLFQRVIKISLKKKTYVMCRSRYLAQWGQKCDTLVYLNLSKHIFFLD